MYRHLVWSLDTYKDRKSTFFFFFPVDSSKPGIFLPIEAWVHTTELLDFFFVCFDPSHLAKTALNSAVLRNELAAWVSKETLWTDRLQVVSQFENLKQFSAMYLLLCAVI